MSSTPARPAGSNTINPFLMTDDAARIIDFVIEVFGATDVPEARTVDTDGLILHSELRIGDSVITVADRKPDWPFTPGFIQVYVDDVEGTLARAVGLGARIVTRPTDFFGDTFSRFADPSGKSLVGIRPRSAGADVGRGRNGRIHVERIGGRCGRGRPRCRRGGLVELHVTRARVHPRKPRRGDGVLAGSSARSLTATDRQIRRRKVSCDEGSTMSSCSAALKGTPAGAERWAWKAASSR